MSLPEEIRSRLELLVGQLVDGTIEDRQQAELIELLSGSAPARAYYLMYMSIHSGLTWKHQPMPVDVSTTADLAGSLQAQPAATLPRRSSAGRTSRPVPLPTTRGGWRRSLAETVWHQIMLVPLLAVVSAGVLAWQLSQRAPQPVVRQPVTPQGDVTPLAPIAEPRDRPVIARLTRSVNALWEEKTSPAPRAPLAAGQKLTLARGLVEIVFNTGATVVLEGPAELEVGTKGAGVSDQGSEDIGDNACSLAIGKLFARVPPKAHGFTVHTPSMKIVDLGTEFGVEVKLEAGTRNVERGTKQSDPRSTFRVPHSSSTQVQVFQGEVAIGPAADAMAQAPAEKPAMILRAGEGATTDADGQSPRKIQANATVFVREIPEKVADSAATIVIDNFRAGEDFSTSSPRVVSYVGDGPLGGHREIIVQTIQGTNTTSLSTREGALSVQTTGSADTNVNWGTMDQGNSSQLDLAIPGTWCMQLEFTAFHMETNIRRGGIWLRIRDGKGVMFDYAVAESELDNLKAQNGGVLSVPLSRFMNSTTYNGEVDGVTFTFDDRDMRGTVTEVRFARPEEAQRNPKPGLHDQNKLQENARQSKLR